ncbi:b4aa8a9d-069b-49f1-8cd9-551315fc6011 [Sclerotinia trifoliorum]|uniref:B4aa8a9d-069b-49f1-8cd9-551315fc6011 n=1 Tax=Sclerotinia trifoliorum TaxID=28548 RepID=A0A8H2VN15_9HELO|nr:b4aa8a9d-069b-49f1-8cd9-551315fc6011 [Sclerotinia trifoliorum]
MKDRTVFFTYSMVSGLYCAWYIWDSYFYSMLTVVFKYNGRLKWLAMYFGVPVTILAVGLMIKFRQPDTNIGYIVMTHIFIAFGGGTLVMCEQMTVMAVSSHQHIPAALPIEAMIASIGGAIGSTIAAALWTAIFLVKLAELLPPSAQADFKTIYGSLTVQSSYPIGSQTRTSINQAYGDTQMLMLICATCLYSVTLVSTMLWRDINVKQIKQIKGRIW